MLKSTCALGADFNDPDTHAGIVTKANLDFALQVSSRLDIAFQIENLPYLEWLTGDNQHAAVTHVLNQTLERSLAVADDALIGNRYTHGTPQMRFNHFWLLISCRLQLGFKSLNR